MKKVFALLLTLALIASLTVATLASTGSAAGQNTSKDLAVDYKEMVSSGSKVYSVDIAWSAVAFAYDAGNQGAWNPDDHTFSTPSDAQWTVDTINVTITNHSNAAVTATVAVIDGDTADGLTVTCDNGPQTLAAGEEGNYEGAANATFALTIDGVPTGAIAKVATATVTIADGE